MMDAEIPHLGFPPPVIKKGDRILFQGKPARVTNVREEKGTTHLEGFFMETWHAPEIVEPTMIQRSYDRGTLSWDARFSNMSMIFETKLYELGDHEIKCTFITYGHGWGLWSR